MASSERLNDIAAKRTKLPAVMLQREQISIWSILKQSIGKELSKITMPVVFNEPLSFLQRLAENMEYTDLLVTAAKQTDPIKRLEDMGFRIVMEQVCHHPPISAFCAENPKVFRFHGSVYPKLRFWGRSVEILPKGVLTLELVEHKETYTWNSVNCSVHNLVIGKPYIEQHGVMEITNHSNGLKCVLNFKPGTWFGRDSSNHIEGHVTDRNKRKLRGLYGEWTEFLASCPLESFEQNFGTWGKEHKEHRWNIQKQKKSSTTGTGPSAEDGPNNSMPKRKLSVIPILNGSEILWRANPRPACSDDFYHFTCFAFILNEQIKDKRLPPTDSRLRPDMRLMENGELDAAAKEKHRLEEKQRDARNQRRKAKKEEEPKPLWFHLEDHPQVKQEKYWRFLGKYWNRDWSNSVDIF